MFLQYVYRTPNSTVFPPKRSKMKTKYNKCQTLEAIRRIFWIVRRQESEIFESKGCLRTETVEELYMKKIT